MRRWRYVFVGVVRREGVSYALFAQWGPEWSMVRYVRMSRLVMIHRIRKARRAGHMGRAAQIAAGLIAVERADGRVEGDQRSGDCERRRRE